MANPSERRRRSVLSLILIAAAAALAPAPARAADAPAEASAAAVTSHATSVPDEFTDPETHLRVVHLSRFPNQYSGVIYFTYPCITQDSRTALIDQQYADKWRHLFAVDLQTLAVKPLVTDRLTQNQVLAPRSGNLYYQADNAAWVIDVHGGAPRKIADLPARWSPGAGFSVNADETLLAGASTDVDSAASGPPTAEEINHASTRPALGDIFSKHLPNVLFTIDLKSGAVKVIHRVDTWLGHVQFSPTDPDLLMFCHEGPWERVDRIWTIQPSTGEAKVFYHRTEPREIAGHEFWQPDGKAIWFQQTFRDRKTNFLAGQDVATGKLTQYPLTPETSSIHHTFSPDGSFFVGDGGGKEKTGPGKYLSMLVPENGRLKLTHLVSLQKNDYAIEPNPHVSPDNRWVIFTATLSGTPQAYGVEIPPAMLPAHQGR